MGKSKIPVLVDLAVIFLVSIATLSGLIFSDSWPRSHEGIRYLSHFGQFKDAFDSGILYPRWMPNYYGGCGYPLFLFYQPGYFFFLLFFNSIVPDILVAGYCSIIAMFFLGGAGAYCLIRQITLSRVTALFCSVMFLLTPYIYVNLYVRGDLSELASMLVLPWPMYFLLLLKERITCNKAFMPCLLILSLSLAALVFCHPFTSLFFYPLFVVIMLIICREIERAYRYKFLMACVFSLTCAVIFSSPYWFSAFQMKEYVDYKEALSGYFTAGDHVVYCQQLFSRDWGFGDSQPALEDSMSFQLGFPHFLAALTGFFLNRKSRFYISMFLLYIACIVMMSPMSTVIWNNVPLLSMVQFPWRLLTVVALLQVVCISGLAVGAEAFIKKEADYNLLLVSLLFFTLIWNYNQFKVVRVENTDVRGAITTLRNMQLGVFGVLESANEYLPKIASKYQPVKPRGEGAMIEVKHPNCRIEEYPHSNPHHLRYRITNRQPQLVLINQLYFPGWKVILNDRAFDDSYLLKNISRDGRIQIGIPAGENMYLEAFYEGPPGWYLRNLLIAFTAIAVFILIILENRKFKLTAKTNGII